MADMRKLREKLRPLIRGAGGATVLVAGLTAYCNYKPASSFRSGNLMAPRPSEEHVTAIEDFASGNLLISNVTEYPNATEKATDAPDTTSASGATANTPMTGTSEDLANPHKLAGIKPKSVANRIEVLLSAGALAGGSGPGKAGVARVIARKNSAVRRCYEGALRRTPDLTDNVKVRFTVGTEGIITAVTVIAGSDDLSSCVKAKFMRIRGLPLLSTPQSFTQGYVFTKR